MNKILSNQFFTAEITKVGAEVLSFKRLVDHCEYIWNGDENYWSGRSPILFPIVCALKNGETKIDGAVYKIGNHGFAKKGEFELIEESCSKAVYRLTYNEESMTIYPYKFILYIIYTLSENKLKIEYKVENDDNKTIYFQIGTHPGFNCPLDINTEFEDYYIEFECAEKLERLYMNSANIIISDKSKSVELKDGRILPLKHELFNEGALVFKNVTSQKVTLKSNKTDKNVVLTYEDLPNMGIWQAKNAPFICMEPWHGLADTEDFNGEFKEKDLIVSLEKDASYQCSYTIEIN